MEGVEHRPVVEVEAGHVGAYKTPWLRDMIAQSARKLASFLSKTKSVDARGLPQSLPSGLAGESSKSGSSTFPILIKLF